MSKNQLKNKHKLAAVFASWTILIAGALSLTGSMSLDYYSVFATLKKVIPASFAMGFIGWMMGSILDKPRRRRPVFHNSLFIKEVTKKENDEQEEMSFDSDVME
ncbi:MAG TPA: hypothetical protein PLG15_01445 [Candidatus Gastranaerophilaceae bacterium]|nr:hypothetical protein [Candidatus Gastranaerophilaceae bacterium]HPT41032.1 hypothetical protein [Candidatus Gastranaerophilaceae bacterium]